MEPRAVQAELHKVFTRWGLPEHMRVDNGTPWGSQGDLPSALALWLIGLGIKVMWNRPRHSQENGIVERTHGVVAQWVEPERAAGAQALQGLVDWATQIQREKYPAIDGQSRAAAYPALMEGARPYDPAQEEAVWDLDLVDEFLARGVWSRRVSKVGRISLYNRDYAVGRAYAGRDVSVRFDAASRAWVILDNQGDEITRHAAKEISKERILALDVSRKK